MDITLSLGSVATIVGVMSPILGLIQYIMNLQMRNMLLAEMEKQRDAWEVRLESAVRDLVQRREWEFEIKATQRDLARLNDCIRDLEQRWAEGEGRS